MDIQTLEQLNSLIATYEKLIKVQNETIRIKEENIIVLKKYIEIQELEKQVHSLISINQFCLN